MILRVLAAVLLLTGCTAPVLQVPIGQAALVYADAKTAYTVLALRVHDQCLAGKMPKDTCVYLHEQDLLAKQIDGDIRKGILSATGEVDWSKVMEILKIIAGLAAKAI